MKILCFCLLEVQEKYAGSAETYSLHGICASNERGIRKEKEETENGAWEETDVSHKKSLKGMAIENEKRER